MTVTRLRRAAGTTALGLVMAWLAGCATDPPSATATVPHAEPRAVTSAQPPAPWASFEQAQRQLAEQALARGHLADADAAYEVLTLLRPGHRAYAEARNLVQRRIGRVVSDAWARGQAAQRRGDADAATDAYLQLLSAMPTHAAAADALRSLEVERSRRQLVGRFSRPVLARRGGADSPMRGAQAPAARAGVRNHLEHATLLARQGEIDEAIAVLRQSPTGRSDGAVNALLVDLHLQRARSLLARDPLAARVAVDAALALDPRHSAALALARQLPRAPASGTPDTTKPPGTRQPGR